MRLTRAPVVATVPVTDIERAREFYGKKLGLEICESKVERGELLYETGEGSHILVYLRPNPPKSDVTQLSFLVDDLRSTMETLRGMGIRFEEYDLPNVKTEGGVASYDGEKTAWFKDPEGNIIAISENDVGSHVLAGECAMHAHATG